MYPAKWPTSYNSTFLTEYVTFSCTRVMAGRASTRVGILYFLLRYPMSASDGENKQFITPILKVHYIVL